MRKITLIAGILIATTLIAVAQEESEYKTLNAKEDVNTIFKKPHSNGGYGSITFGFGVINDKNTFISGFRGGWIIDHGIALGIGGYAFVNNLDLNYTSNKVGLAGGYGGFLIEPIIKPKSPVHVSFPILIGAGGLTTFEDIENWENYEYNGAAFFVFVPGVELELNVVKFFRIAIGVNYRFTPDIELNDITGESLVPKDVMRGFTATLTLKFGKF